MKEHRKKIIKEIAIIVGIFILLIFCLAFLLQTNDSLRFKFDYESENRIAYTNGKTIKVKIPWKNPIVYLEENQIIDTLKTKTGIVYFGYPSCPWCRNVVPILLETAIEENISPIYYVESHQMSDATKAQLIEYLGDYLETKEETNQKVLAVPDVYFLKEGKIIGHHLSTVESYKNPYKGMNQEQKQELKNIYLSFIKEIQK